MSLGTSNRDGGKTSESGHLRAIAKLVAGDVLEGLAVTQRGAGVNMSVDVAVGDAFVRRSDGSYAHPVFNDAVYNQAISAADGSNPRRDIIVLYVDYGQTPSTLVSNNTNGVVKIKVVNGTPAGSPVDPADATIQSSVGAGNPWTKLARVRVPAGQASISNTLIDDLRVLTYNKSNTVATAALQALSVTAAKIDFSTFMQTEARFPGSNGVSGYSVAALNAAAKSGSVYGSGIFTMAADGSITVIKKCIITITWSAYIEGTGAQGFMWLINKNSTTINTGLQAGTGYSGTTDFRYNSATVSVLALPGDVFRVGYYKSVGVTTATDRDGCSVAATAVN